MTTMVVEEERTQNTEETEETIETTMVEEVEAASMEAVVDMAEEVMVDTTATTTMVEEAVVASLEAQAAAEDIMGTTTSTSQINNTDSPISSNQCSNQYHNLIWHPAMRSSRITTWTAMLTSSAMTMVVNGVNNFSNGCD